MLIMPAIDIQDGCVVRYTQGRLDKKVYSRDPVKTAKHWLRQGASFIHIVDLDGAFTGKPKNLPVVKEIVKNVNVPLQFGGGVRNMKAITALLDCGVSRVVLGTKAVEDRGFLKKALKKFGDKIIVSLDTKLNHLLIKGWKSNSKGTNTLKFARLLKDMGFQQVIYTDILKDGTLKGPSIQEIKKLLKETQMGIIASGGISSLDDLHRLKLLEKQGLVGVIVGKALYEGRFTLSQALKFA